MLAFPQIKGGVRFSVASWVEIRPQHDFDADSVLRFLNDDFPSPGRLSGGDVGAELRRGEGRFHPRGLHSFTVGVKRQS